MKITYLDEVIHILFKNRASIDNLITERNIDLITENTLKKVTSHYELGSYTITIGTLEKHLYLNIFCHVYKEYVFYERIKIDEILKSDKKLTNMLVDLVDAQLKRFNPR